MSLKSIAIIVNLLVALIAIIGTFVLVKKLKFDDNNSRIIFVLYTIYWVAPLLCRDYTTATHVHMGLSDAAKLMWIPVAAFGLVGIFWRPLNDILTYKLKSRKLIIYISLLIQLVTIFPYLLYPCFETNIIQSIGSGVGASGIGLFTLMFNENQNHHRKFLTISIFALPPIIAGFIVSAIESFVACYIPSGHDIVQYQSVIWYIWLIALIFILLSFVITFFVREKRETLYQDKQHKQVVAKASGHWQIVLLCICGVCLSLIRWATSGPFAGMQLTYIANKMQATDTNLWEGYLGLTYSFGCLIGSVISAIAIVKSNTNRYQPIIVAVAVTIWILYLGITCSYLNVPVYVCMNLVNGIGFGLLWNIFLQIILNRFYLKRDIITPIGIFNTSLSLGIVIGSIFIGFTKAKYFDFHVPSSFTWDNFVMSNYTTSIILVCIAVFMLAIFVAYYFINCNSKKIRKWKDRSIKLIGENEI